MTGRRVRIIYFKAGGGHVNAKNALMEALETSHPDWDVEAVNLYDILKSVDPISNLTLDVSESKILGKFLKLGFKHILKKSENFEFKPFSIEDVYNFALKKGITIGMGSSLYVLQAFIRYKSPQIRTLLQHYWAAAAKPDLVVSVIPNFNRELFASLSAVYPNIPYATIMTDMVDLKRHPGFWMTQQDQYLICGTPEAYAQAMKLGCYDPNKVALVSGMILRQSFYQAPEQPLTHADIGFDPQIPTLAIMFGGNGAAVSADIVRYLNEARLGVQTIVICGSNQALYSKLNLLIQRGEITGCHPVGFTDKVAQLFRLACGVVGKPGPASISEALQTGCAMITAGKGVMPQEAFNLKFIRKNGIGIVVESFEREPVVEAVRILLDDLRGGQIYKKNIAMLPRNNAAAEIVDTLEKILKNHAVVTGNNLPITSTRLASEKSFAA